MELIMPQPATKKPTNMTLDSELLAQARSMNVNLSQAAEAGLRKAVTAAKEEAWKRDNAAAVSSANQWVDENGLPLERFRQF